MNYAPTLEYEGWNPGLKTDCDNLNWSSANSGVPRIGSVDVKDAGDPPFLPGQGCAGQRTDIREQADIRLAAGSSGGHIQANTTYNQYIVFSKTYLYDTNPSWREVNFSYEEIYGEQNLGKLKYDIRGSANGGIYVTNGQYVPGCSSPTNALPGFPSC